MLLLLLLQAVATGHEPAGAAPDKPSWRFPPDEMVFMDRFGEPVPGVPHEL
jgi:hypothetical protein